MASLTDASVDYETENPDSVVRGWVPQLISVAAGTYAAAYNGPLPDPIAIWDGVNNSTGSTRGQFQLSKERVQINTKITFTPNAPTSGTPLAAQELRIRLNPSITSGSQRHLHRSPPPPGSTSFYPLFDAQIVLASAPNSLTAATETTVARIYARYLCDCSFALLAEVTATGVRRAMTYADILDADLALPLTISTSGSFLMPAMGAASI